MKELIKINDDNRVDGRELHEFLQLDTPFKKWIDRMIDDYGFVMGTDFWTKMSKTSPMGGRPSTEYTMTIGMAKEICMIQRNERGKQARLYFIECERRLKESLIKDSYMIDDPVERAKRWIEEETTRQEQAKQLEEQRPMVVFANAVSTSDTSILMGGLAKLICQNGVSIGQKRLFQWMRENGWLIKSGTEKNMPTQKAMNMKLFEVKEGSYVDGQGVNRITRTTKVTGKGQVYFVNKFLSMN